MKNNLESSSWRNCRIAPSAQLPISTQIDKSKLGPTLPTIKTNIAQLLTLGMASASPRSPGINPMATLQYTITTKSTLESAIQGRN